MLPNVFYYVITGLIFDIVLRENSTDQIKRGREDSHDSTRAKNCGTKFQENRKRETILRDFFLFLLIASIHCCAGSTCPAGIMSTVVDRIEKVTSVDDLFSK